MATALSARAKKASLKNLQLPDLEGILREKAARHLKDFVKQAWQVIEPARPFIESWHIDAICEHLQAVFEGQILNLLINVSPRRSKSTVVAKCWPAWGWIKRPAFDWLFASFSAARAISDSVDCRRIIESPWYKRNWGDKFYLTSDQNQKSRFENSTTGKRLALGLLGGGTGEGGDAICVSKWTRVTTRFANPLITDIQIGDEVLSFNHEYCVAEYREVVKIHKRFYMGSVISIDTGEGSKLRCTNEHPIYVVNRGYINADHLEQGDTVLFCDLSVHIPEWEGICRRDQEFLFTHDRSSQSRFQGDETERSLSGDQKIRMGKYQDQTIDDLWNAGNGGVYGAKSDYQIEDVKTRWIQSIDGRGTVSQWNQRDRMERGDQGNTFSEIQSDVGESRISKKAAVSDYVTGSEEKARGDEKGETAQNETYKGEKTGRSIEAKNGRGASRDCRETKGSNGETRCARSLVFNGKETMGGFETARMEKDKDQIGYDERNAYENFSIGIRCESEIVARSGISPTDHGWPFAIKAVKIKSISRVMCALAVYNLEIEGNNNYFADGVLTHNCCDDPHDINDAYNPKKLKTDIDAWDQVFSQRANDPKLSRKVVVMQRISGRDLGAHLRKQGGYELLILPTEYDPKRSVVTALGWKDPRTVHGELLNPERFGPREIVEAKLTLAARGFAAQHQQNPSEDEGAIFKRPFWRYYRQRPEDLVKEMDTVILSVDCAFKDEQSSSLVAIHAWGKKGANKYLLDRDSTHKDFVGTVRALMRMAESWPSAVAKVIEDKANGPAVINVCENTVPGLLSYQPEGSKVSRANAMQPEHEAGNIWLPHPDMCGWTEEFVEICAAFPEGEFDDDIDAMTQAWDWFRTHDSGGVEEMIANNMDIPDRTRPPNLW